MIDIKDIVLIRDCADNDEWLYRFEIWSDVKAELLTSRLEKVPGTLWFQPGFQSMGKCLQVAVDPRYDGQQVKAACIPIIHALAGIVIPEKDDEPQEVSEE